MLMSHFTGTYLIESIFTNFDYFFLMLLYLVRTTTCVFAAPCRGSHPDRNYGKNVKRVRPAPRPLFLFRQSNCLPASFKNRFLPLPGLAAIATKFLHGEKLVAIWLLYQSKSTTISQVADYIVYLQEYMALKQKLRFLHPLMLARYGAKWSHHYLLIWNLTTHLLNTIIFLSPALPPRRPCCSTCSSGSAAAILRRAASRVLISEQSFTWITFPLSSLFPLPGWRGGDGRTQDTQTGS